MSREDAELARLVRLARQADLPDAARLARVRAKIMTPTAAPAPASNAPLAAGKGILGAKIVAGLAAVGLGVWSYTDLTRAVPEATVPTVAPASQPAEAPEPERASASALPDLSEPQTPREAAIKPRSKRPRSTLASEPSGTLAQETALLQLAAIELRAGQLDRARATLAEFVRRYPNASLQADRERLERRLAQSAR